MTGLELSKRYFEELGRPALERCCPELLPRMAAGLVGEGSECYGYDDAVSQDHDWGPGFCLWLTDADTERYGAAAEAAYASLPRRFLDYERLRTDPLSAGRVGVFRIGDFYERFLGLRHPPETVGEWLALQDQALSVCTNGAVFADGTGAFSAFRDALLAYYPEDIRRKRLAARCALAAQAGQYNYPRCLSRGDRVAAFRALAEFVDHAQAALFLLARRYRPYYKWAHRALQELPGIGKTVGPLFASLVGEPRQETIETICAEIVRLLAMQGLSNAADRFLLPHGKAVQSSISRESVRSLPLFSFP